MRHGKKFNHLGRKTAHRKAMLANMACSLIEHKRINTTVAKAKALRQFVEPLITKSKPENNVTAEKGTHNRRIVFKNLRDKYAVTELFGTVAEKVADRPGGYTRIIKLGNRLGDNADMAMIELVDFNELYNAGKPKKKSTRRSRRSGGSKKDENKAADTAEETQVNKAAESKAAESTEATAEVEAKKSEGQKAEGETAKAETPKAKTEEAPKVESEGKADPKSEAKEDSSKAEDKPKAEVKAEDKPKADAKPEAEAKSESKADAEPKAESKPKNDGEDTDTKKDDSKE